MRTRIKEEICPVEGDSVENEASNECVENESPRKGQKTNQLANVKCLECHCVGTVMKTVDGIVLSPNKVKKTLIDLGGGFFMPNLKKMMPVEKVKLANQKAKEFMEGFNVAVEKSEDNGPSKGFFKKIRERFTRGIRMAEREKKVRLADMLEREKKKTPARDAPDQFRGIFSDEFEENHFWRSKKRFSLQ
ncbi:Oidioi.mRNA.OKI2018_I69.XSR.g16834.t1.cds [Oikopleura dioica]|uniref:Oidioi.mRNA.OKI2018_I69.XSR.g16834.t1.cds n=1 Tax=Oikopleura dioica TaxID=34765 RepID=A0ABN7SL98_OIKDI|nr:Oidioi.mRNA.OKI2018_I69.XSR.g16834.t1.cds [Oikopleura dioica]